MASFAFDIAPPLLGRELMRAAPQYVANAAIQPILVHDYNALRTKQVQLPRFRRWGERSWTKASRRRDKLSLIGTANSEGLSSSMITLDIFEMTGPSTTDGQASTLWLTKEDVLFARANLFQYGAQTFHESIGSANLSDDYQGFMDRISILELMNTTVKFNPSNKVDASTLITDRITSNDLDRIRYQLVSRNTRRFPDGYFHAIIDELMLVHLLQDPDFKQFALAFIQGGMVPIANSPLVTVPQQTAAMVGGTPIQQLTGGPIPPIVYKHFMMWSSNNVPTRTVNSLTANLGLFFGLGAVGYGSGGPGVQVRVNNNTDFDRHFNYIWSHWCDLKYLLEDDSNSGCAVEARTYGGL